MRSVASISPRADDGVRNPARAVPQLGDQPAWRRQLQPWRRHVATVLVPAYLLAMFAVVNRFNRAWEEAATDLGASSWQKLRYVTLPILAPGIIGVAMGAFTLSYDEYARTTLTVGPKNTLPLEIYALISSASSPTLFAIGTLTTTVSFLIIGLTVLMVLRLQRRRLAATMKSG